MISERVAFDFEFAPLFTMSIDKYILYISSTIATMRTVIVFQKSLSLLSQLVDNKTGKFFCRRSTNNIQNKISEFYNLLYAKLRELTLSCFGVSYMVLW